MPAPMETSFTAGHQLGIRIGIHQSSGRTQEGNQKRAEFLQPTIDQTIYAQGKTQTH